MKRRQATEAEARALASAVRLRILRLCLDQPRTNKEIAERLHVHPATTLHHVRKLVDTGFLAAQEVRRGTRGAREVPYLATGKSWTLDVHETGVTGGGAAMLAAFLEEVRLVDADDAGFARLGLRLTDDEVTELGERLTALFDEYAARPPSAGGKPYSIFFSLHEDVTRDARRPAS
jgi:DNA-binding transcriptional ArsR family regulator